MNPLLTKPLSILVKRHDLSSINLRAIGIVVLGEPFIVKRVPAANLRLIPYLSKHAGQLR